MSGPGWSTESVNPTDGGHWRVLVVDDDQGMRETLSDILAAQSLAVVAAATAAAAERIAREEPIALAIVDQRLPDALGTDLADRLKQHDPDLPVLLLTGYASAEIAMAAVGKAEDFLVKPVHPEHVLSSVNNALDRRWLRMRNAELVSQLQQANAVLADNVRRRQNELTTLIAMTTAVSASSRLPIVLDAAVDVLGHMSGTTVAAVYLRNDDDRLALSAVRADEWRPPSSLPTFSERVKRATIDGRECSLAAFAADGVMIGALLLERNEQEADAFLVALAAQVAVGVENARRSERERATVERMAELNRMKSSFLANVSHELRTPLTAVIGFARTLQGRGTNLSDDERARLLDRIETQARRLHRLVEDLLDEAHLDRGAMRVSNAPVRVAEVVERVVSSLPDNLHRIAVALPPAAPIVIADADRLEQVLGNLVDNARKYSPTGSLITIGGTSTDRGFELTVVDEGRGIDEGFLPHLFEPFTQADIGDTRRDHGVGLGLAICRGLVEAMGGVIEAGNEPGGGSRFTVVLRSVVPAPAAPADDQIDERAAAVTPDAGRR
ncbi:MAG: response regulator [Frankiales bacterium]|nr:response regulator [Frankiales bacterium]